MIFIAAPGHKSGSISHQQTASWAHNTPGVEKVWYPGYQPNSNLKANFGRAEGSAQGGIIMGNLGTRFPGNLKVPQEIIITDLS